MRRPWTNRQRWRRSMRSSVSSEPQTVELPTYDDVRRAAERLAGQAVATPLLESGLLNERIGGPALVKGPALPPGRPLPLPRAPQPPPPPPPPPPPTPPPP